MHHDGTSRRRTRNARFRARRVDHSTTSMCCIKCNSWVHQKNLSNIRKYLTKVAVDFVCRKCSGFANSTEVDEKVTLDGNVKKKSGKVLLSKECSQLWKKSARSCYCKNKIWTEDIQGYSNSTPQKSCVTKA